MTPLRYCGLSILTMIVLGASGCAAPFSPPTAAEILAKPANSNMRDGHFKMSGHISSGTFTTEISGQGVLTLKPHYAMSMQMQGSLGQLAFTAQSIDIDGKSYSRTGSEKWTQSQAKAQPGMTSGTTNAKLIGEENLSVGKTWHVRGTDSSGRPVDIWVRESDGYMVKYSGSTDGASIALEFDQFNTGTTVTAPSPSDIKPPPRQLTAKVGDAAALNGVTVTVVTVDVNATPKDAYFGPKPDNRWVVVQVLYENTGSEKVSYNPFDWKLTDALGFSYDTTYTGIGPELHSGDLAPGEKARGYLSYEVPRSATTLSLKFAHDDDSVTVVVG